MEQYWSFSRILSFCEIFRVGNIPVLEKPGMGCAGLAPVKLD